MNVLLVAPMEPPRRVEIENSLESMQTVVGGFVQAVYPFDEPVALVCNDEGKLLGLEDSEHFESLSEEQMARYTARFALPEVFL